MDALIACPPGPLCLPACTIATPMAGTMYPGGIWIDYREGKYSYQEVVDSVDSSHLPIPDEEVFLPQLLKTAGYYTAQVGKLEWGFATTPNRLKRHGWDYHFGYYDHKCCHGFYPKSLFRNGEEVFFEGNTLSGWEDQRTLLLPGAFSKRDIGIHQEAPEAKTLSFCITQARSLMVM